MWVGGGRHWRAPFLPTHQPAPFPSPPPPPHPQWAFAYHADFGMFRWDRHDPTSARTPRGSLPTVLRELAHLKRHVEAAWARRKHAVDAAGNVPPGVFVSVAAGVRALAAGGRRPAPAAGNIVSAPPRRAQKAKPAAAATAAPAQKRARRAVAATVAAASPPPKRAATRTRAAAAAPAKPAAPARTKRGAPAAAGGRATRARTR